jgi:hypothetical protein
VYLPTERPKEGVRKTVSCGRWLDVHNHVPGTAGFLFLTDRQKRAKIFMINAPNTQPFNVPKPLTIYKYFAVILLWYNIYYYVAAYEYIIIVYIGRYLRQIRTGCCPFFRLQTNRWAIFARSISACLKVRRCTHGRNIINS